MKIVHISTSITGGAGVAAFRIHLSLLKYSDIKSIFVQQYNIDSNQLDEVYTLPRTYTWLYRIQKKLNLRPERRYKKIIGKHPHNYEIITLPTTAYRIEEHPMVKEADIINLHWVGDFLNYPSFFKNIKQPIVWTLHDMNPFMGIFHYEDDKQMNKDELSKVDSQILRKKQKRIHKKKNIHVVCPSNWLKKKSEESETFQQYKHIVIKYGLDFEKYPILNRIEKKNKININNGRATILMVAHGLDIRRKGFDLLSEALNKLRNKKFNLISVGAGNISLNESINHIHFDSINDIAQLNEIYSAADITVLPSREDNLPNVMLESFANGTPVISFSNGGMAEHITTGENGILIEEISSDSLAKAIQSFLDGEYTFDNERIRDYCITNFSDKLQADSYTQLYNDILNNPQP